jgi:hypothetical protein
MFAVVTPDTIHLPPGEKLQLKSKAFLIALSSLTFTQHWGSF